MRRFRTFALPLVVVAVAAALMIAGQSVWLGVGVVAVAVLLWASTGCFHPRPLSLLPPTRTADGEATEARWFCGACGRSWPAMIDHPHPPIPRFVGHDESKAVAAAKRANALELRTRELAVRRSGAATASPNAPHTPRHAQPIARPVAVPARRVS